VQLLAGPRSPEADRFGVLIHASDTATAFTAGLRRQLPPRVAILTTGISLTNTVLAVVIAWPVKVE
jgi:hypothetical protein